MDSVSRYNCLPIDYDGRHLAKELMHHELDLL